MIYFGTWWVKWLKNRVGQDCMFYEYSCKLYFLVKIWLVKLNNLPTSAYLKINYCTAKQTKNVLQKWWNLSKLVTNTLVNFADLFKSIILCSLSCSGKNIFIKRCSGGMDILVCLGNNVKNLAESFAWEHE